MDIPAGGRGDIPAWGQADIPAGGQGDIPAWGQVDIHTGGRGDIPAWGQADSPAGRWGAGREEVVLDRVGQVVGCSRVVREEGWDRWRVEVGEGGLRVCVCVMEENGTKF